MQNIILKYLISKILGFSAKFSKKKFEILQFLKIILARNKWVMLSFYTKYSPLPYP